MSSVQPVILTADQDALLGFYKALFGAEEIFRVPADGPAFYLGLRIGDTDLGLVAKTNLESRAAPRILLIIGVDDLDETLGQVERLGGSVRSWRRPSIEASGVWLAPITQRNWVR
ncbi:VOC family protein [Streptomyces sp. NPDC048324]|uniref:VOC family protein n=1 Tax=Streptomyces sp. NPDC048324 TaxID=3157205 RepID=UPI003436D2B1